MLVPTVPAFTLGDSSVARLQQLSSCVSWLANSQASPMWHLYRNTTFSIGATSWTTIPMTYAALDTDRSWSGTGVSLNTQGYFVTEACVPFLTSSTAAECRASFLWTAGANNPHFSSGSTVRYGLSTGYSIGASGADETEACDDVCPVVCYPGDTIVVQAYASSAMTIDTDIGTPLFSRVVCNFTGHWVRVGS